MALLPSLPPTHHTAPLLLPAQGLASSTSPEQSPLKKRARRQPRPALPSMWQSWPLSGVARAPAAMPAAFPANGPPSPFASKGAVRSSSSHPHELPASAPLVDYTHSITRAVPCRLRDTSVLVNAHA